MNTRLVLAAAALAQMVASPIFAADSIAPIPRLLPPAGIEIPAEQRRALEDRHAELTRRFAPHAGEPLAPDAAVYLKAVEYALAHGEFYDLKDVNKAQDLLARAEERIGELTERKASWTNRRGLVVRGYRSAIDGSPQPYGLVIPENLDLEKPAPLYVWLHGRGDKQTDLHFIAERQSRAGQITPPGAVVLHPFGRHCLGFKSAGEIDVLEALAHVQANYKIDPRRVVLIGFSMGGAGAWHLGAHYTDRWAAVSPGAGFAETARYQRLRPENFPPAYEQALWGMYDVPNYVRNLFNLPVVAYSGELDKQKQAADVMAEAFAEQGRTLTHIIGPGVEHKYEPNALKEVLARLEEAAAEGRPAIPKTVHLQTRTLRYNKQSWVEALGLAEHWQDSRIEAQIVGPKRVQVSTANITAFRLSPLAEGELFEAEIDGEKIACRSGESIVKRSGWQAGGELPPVGKRHGLQGPIDDAFLEPFLVVLPSAKSKHPRVEAWVEFESRRFLERWRALFRGEPRVKRDVEVTPADLRDYHLVAWGDGASNALLARALGDCEPKWAADTVAVGEARHAAESHVSVFIRPNPLSPGRYLVVNSGPTFREAHDRTNSLQNPKLPDWAIIDLSQPPSASQPGRIVSAGFYDEAWRIR